MRSYRRILFHYDALGFYIGNAEATDEELYIAVQSESMLALLCNIIIFNTNQRIAAVRLKSVYSDSFSKSS